MNWRNPYGYLPMTITVYGLYGLFVVLFAVAVVQRVKDKRK
jgi:hypothetical protein